jgi:hypothetical protein
MDASIKVILNPSFIFVIRLRLGHLMMHSHCKKKSIESIETADHGDRFNNVKM